MAIFDLSITIMDGYDRSTTRRFKVNVPDFTQAQAALGNLVAAYTAIGEGGVTKGTVSSTIPQVGTPIAGANVDEGVTFSVTLADGGKGIVRLPMPRNSILVAGGAVDLALEDVVTFTELWTDGPFLASDGEIVMAFNSGRLDK